MCSRSAPAAAASPAAQVVATQTAKFAAGRNPAGTRGIKVKGGMGTTKGTEDYAGKKDEGANTLSGSVVLGQTSPVS